MLRVLVRVDLEDLADAVILVPLLEELLFVGRRVTFDEIRQLGEIGSKKYTATHDEDTRNRRG